MRLKSLAILAIVLFLSCSAAIDIPYEQARDALKQAYFLRDFEDGIFQGEKFVNTFPDSLELKAWFELNRLAAYFHIVEDVLETGKTMTRTSPENPWGYFLIIEAYSYLPRMVLGYPGAKYNFRREALSAGKKMITLAPDHPDIIWMYAKALSVTGKFAEADQFIDENLDKSDKPAELITLKGEMAKSQVGWQNPDLQKQQQADSLFQEAIKLDSTCINAYYGLNNYKPEDLETIKKARRFSPYSFELFMAYSQIIQQQKDLSKEKKAKSLEDVIEPLLSKRGNYPYTLYSIASAYSKRGLAMPEKEKHYHELIQKNYPHSVAAEWVKVSRIRAYSRKMYEDKVENYRQSPEYRKMLTDYLDSPNNTIKPLIIETNYDLFESYQCDSTISDKKLLDVAQKLSESFFGPRHRKYYARAANVLTDKTTYFTEAEQIAQTGLDRCRSYVRRQFPDEMSEEEFLKNCGCYLIELYDALGWAQLKANKKEEAEKNLQYAHELNSKDVNNLLHLGKLAEANEDYEKAKSYYADGIKLEPPGENPNEAALKGLCLRVDGNTGFLDQQYQLKAEKRKKEVLSSRLKPAKAASEFNLKALDKRTVSLKDLRGKIAVINTWGIWCGWCVKELPEFQLLHEKYKDDPEVSILTINNDKNPEDVPAWMEKQKYDFTVLLDDGYVKKAGVSSFPTTWFLDKTGNIAYLKEGYTKKLLDEFSWRIESLR